MPSYTKNILTVRDLAVTFTRRQEHIHALRGASLSLMRGRISALAGESGSGKSVLARALLGLLEPNAVIESGEILLDGEDLTKFKTEKQWQNVRGGKIALVSQDPMTSLNPLMRTGHQIEEAIKIHTSLSGKKAKNAAVEAMEAVGIPNAQQRCRDYPHEFSGGQRQRIVLAMALAGNPSVLAADEPTTALDITVQSQILKLIRSLASARNLAVLFISHDMSAISQIADDISVMYAGQVIESATADELFSCPAHPYTWALLECLPENFVKGERLYTLPGAPPSLVETITGDAFAPRSAYALNIDAELPAPVFTLSPTHTVRSWLADPRAPRITPPASIRRTNS